MYPQSGGSEYISVTVFEGQTPQTILGFFNDDEHRMTWCGALLPGPGATCFRSGQANSARTQLGSGESCFSKHFRAAGRGPEAIGVSAARPRRSDETRPPQSPPREPSSRVAWRIYRYFATCLPDERRAADGPRPRAAGMTCSRRAESWRRTRPQAPRRSSGRGASRSVRARDACGRDSCAARLCCLPRVPSARGRAGAFSGCHPSEL